MKTDLNSLKDIFEIFRGKVQIVNGNDEVSIVTQNIEALLNKDPSMESRQLFLIPQREHGQTMVTH